MKRDHFAQSLLVKFTASYTLSMLNNIRTPPPKMIMVAIADSASITKNLKFLFYNFYCSTVLGQYIFCRFTHRTGVKGSFAEIRNSAQQALQSQPIAITCAIATMWCLYWKLQSQQICYPIDFSCLDKMEQTVARPPFLASRYQGASSATYHCFKSHSPPWSGLEGAKKQQKSINFHLA